MAKEAAARNPALTVCSPRSAASGRAVPLSLVRAGEKTQVRFISGKDDIRRFLRNIGFVEDAEVTVVTEMNGNVIVNVKGTRVAISKSMARRIMTA